MRQQDMIELGTEDLNFHPIERELFSAHQRYWLLVRVDQLVLFLKV